MAPALCLVALAAAAPARAAGAVVSDDGRTAWRLGPSGRPERVDFENNSVAHPAGAALPPLSALAGPAGGRLFALSPGADGKATALLALAEDTLEVQSRWEVRGQGRFLEVTPDGEAACVLASRGSGWSLHVLDIRAARQAAASGEGESPAPAARTVALPFTPQAVTLMPDREAPGGFRLVVASAGRLTTFALDPPAPSWFYKSPGDHHAVRPLADDRALVALRDEALVFFEPAQRPRDHGRVRLGDDDATRVVPLSPAGEDLAVTLDGGTTAGIAVLHRGGTALSWFDPRDGRLLENRTLATPRLLLTHGRSALLLSAPGGAGERDVRESAAAPALGELPPSSPAPTPAAPTTTPTPAAPSAAPPEAAPATEPAPKIREPRPAAPPETSPERQPTATPQNSRDRPAAPEPQTPAPAPEPPAPPRPDSQPFLSGRVTGEIAGAREVLVYGPGNILKLHARVPIEQDGTFRLPLPPPGSYRILIAPEPGTHVFTRPEFRTIVVPPGGEGLAGIDFQVRGAL